MLMEVSFWGSINLKVDLISLKCMQSLKLKRKLQKISQQRKQNRTIKNSTNQKKTEKQKEIKKTCDKQKINSKMIDVNPVISILISNINTPVKGRHSWI